MSFTANVKNELTRISPRTEERLAILSGIIRNSFEFDFKEIKIITENNSLVRYVYSLIKDTYNLMPLITDRKNAFNRKRLYILLIDSKVLDILKDLSVIDDSNKYLKEPGNYIIDSEEEKRAYLKGAFLIAGSINDPKTSRYHLEFLIKEKKEADFLSRLLNEFDLNSKVIEREKGFMVYIKEAEKIGDFLRIIEASNAVMYFENIRIYRDHKNMTNRLNNCEQANVDKVFLSANNQLEEIEIVLSKLERNMIDEKILEAIDYRKKYPESSLSELSQIMTLETGKKITKSGLNHRFRKIKEIASQLK